MNLFSLAMRTFNKVKAYEVIFSTADILMSLDHTGDIALRPFILDNQIVI